MPTSRPTLDALNIDAVPPGGDYDAEVERLRACGRIAARLGKLN
ncbi:MAG: hypothetical protein R2742_04810 [Micropruina glycogenica]